MPFTLLREIVLDDADEAATSAVPSTTDGVPVDGISAFESASENRASAFLIPQAFISSRNQSGSRRSASANGVGLRSRFGSCTDALRNVIMQQIIEPGGSLNNLELAEIDDESFDDEVQDEANEDDCGEEFANGVLAETAAALREQSGSGASVSTVPGEFKIAMDESNRLLRDHSRFHTPTPSDKHSGGDKGGAASRKWDDEFILKSRLPALIPAFDPRPGRTNVNQTQDVELPQETDKSEKDEADLLKKSAKLEVRFQTSV
ncbi:unnamed protein product [Gongylonema pulchrum]|uniref:Uncharacterized protein n=1 Tax=Gongylonema pulchrum TaxID=637853 RepID=A0A3P6Q828_9BILA|nr:unnamed protein product [Gongylonema pulchrum]